MRPWALLVLGVCAPERHRYAEALRRILDVPIVNEPGRTRHGAPRSPSWASSDVVVEAATDVHLPHLLGDDTPPPMVVCVVDAPHMVDDLCESVPLRDDAERGDSRGDVGARGRQAAAFVEAASVVVLVNWESVDTGRLAMLMALASHLSPTARVRLARNPVDDLRLATDPPTDGIRWQERAGWVRALGSMHDPYMSDRRVVTFRYEQLRPFHLSATAEK